ncbi:GH1 family beta-glucosidase [Amycolatopsis tucumanensis]|uniref:Beta-glucosidase n=1 Tax=Amycolatopsis tucumanensis TaxID=401106 RepID=A0ABP7HZU1_9PSEU|nr:GH1 family beta-glucosidase [Amycolatopsis tucumanensis]MCF6428434.1 GH1 family beta-glucosidase [Amycolatopsis tucumanensis]
MENLAFPPGFLWGVSTSAFQIEGATSEDGRGPSVWDTFAPGQADVACDHYHRWPEDVALLTELGVGAYRFSFAWPRIQPAGSGAPNEAGLAFYDRLIDALCEADIAPVATVYHWDTPQPLEDAGGWLNRETAYRFAEYASVLGERFADRVRMWIPLNEPMVTTVFGYAIGEYAPGRTLLLDALPTAHHQHLAHGLAVQALRAAGASNIGTANHHCPVWPTSNSRADHDAAHWLDALLNRTFSDPVLLGSYPAEIEPHLPAGYADDLVNIAQRLDFYGVNYYEPHGAAAPGAGNPLPFELRPIEGFPRTTNDSPIVPAALLELLAGLRDRYGEKLPPVYLTENGASFDGVHDQERIDFLDAHLRSVAAAITAGVEVRGYFVWSLLDNFEWSKGYAPRFGLVHVDYETQRRTPKDSFSWYRKLVRA